jgi:predicted DNA-binding transcriptional regulator YafY
LALIASVLTTTGKAAVYHPTTRVLTTLELLQAHPRLSGAELAARLEVDRRTVRRYVTMLQDLGIPVEATRGRHGGYRLRPGFKLPPLMFSEDEALALTLGLLTARRLGLTSTAPAVEGALAKIERVLPLALRERVGALQQTLALNLNLRTLDADDVPPAGATVVTLSAAARQARRVRLRYRSWSQAETERVIDPYGVVYHAGHWYAAAHCHLRGDLRSFRLDRVLAAEPCEPPDAFTRPEGFDCLAFVLSSLAATPRTYPVEVALYVTLDEARRRVPPSLATLEETPAGVIMRCSTDNPDWMAGTLASLGCDLVVHEPPELRAALCRLAARVAGMASAPALVKMRQS